MILVLLLVGVVAKAQILQQDEVKVQMVERIDVLITTLSEARRAIAKDQTKFACEKIQKLYQLFPDHLLGIGTNMNIFDPKVIKMEQETRAYLIFINKQLNLCSREHSKLTEIRWKLFWMNNKLKKHKNLIKKLDTDYENMYHFYYELN